MAIELTEYLTSNAYKCLAVIAKQRQCTIESLIPRLKICKTDDSLCFYCKTENSGDQLLFQCIEHNWYDAGMKPMDIKDVKISTLNKALMLNKMRKAQKNIVVITFE